jgi:transcriptional/translational regulatory protein YebC/TACO1
MEIIDAGVEDIDLEGEMFVITTALEDFGSVQKRLEELGIEAEYSELQRIPKETKALSIPDSFKILKIIEDFEEDDDVQNVFHNLEVSEEVMAAMEG